MKQDRDILKFIIILLVVLLLWVWGWIFIDKFVEVEQRAGFGDKFGFTNSLFSGLALAVIIYSIRLQQKELNLQRRELFETRAEFKDQNFQTTFFNLLKTQQQISNDINVIISDLCTYNKYDDRIVKGYEFFVNVKIELKRISFALKYPKYTDFLNWDEIDDHLNTPKNDEEEKDLIQIRKVSYTAKYYNINKVQWMHAKKLESVEFGGFCYEIFFSKFQYSIGHYFRHLNHILLFLEEMEKNKMEKQPEISKEEVMHEFQRYANFVQVQMATPELFLVFYNCLYFSKFQKVLIKYNMFENLFIEDLIDSNHNSIDNLNLKSKFDLK
jgi:hypothetical protein